MNRVLHGLLASVRADERATPDDAALLERFLACREEAAFEALLRRHGPMVLGVCRRVLANTHDAEDAFQATFLVLVRKAASIRPRALVGHWLYGVAYRTALKCRTMNAKRRFTEHRASASGTSASPTRSDPWDDVAPLLDRELAGLPEKYRVPVVLCELEGKSRREAARLLKLPEGTLSSRLATARRLLARRLAARGLPVVGGTLAGLLAEKAAPAAVPPALVGSTIRTAMPVALGGALVKHAVPAKIAALTQEVLKAMLVAKLKIVVAVTVTLGLVGSAGWLALPSRADERTASDRPLAKASALSGVNDSREAHGTAFGEGWKKVVPIPAPHYGEGDTYITWVEDGWLQVKRQTKTGRTEWHIVLARAVSGPPPVVATKEGFIIDVSYRRGRYFVRETINVLQSLRERKQGKDGTRQLAEFVDVSKNFLTSTSGGGFPTQPPVLSLWADKEWVVVANSPAPDRTDCFIRLDASDNVSGSGSQSFKGTLRKCTWGENDFVLDDGEALTVTRRLDAEIQRARKVKEAQAALINALVPDLQARGWINSRGVDWSSLRGKVVLLDFWSTGCGPCMDSLVKAQLLQNKLSTHGLVVIGAAVGQGAKRTEEVIRKRGITFPMAMVDWETLNRLAGGGVPAYYLVDRQGRIVRGPLRALPDESAIEELLAK